VPYADRVDRRRRVLNGRVDTETPAADGQHSGRLAFGSRSPPLQLSPEQASGTIDYVKGRGAPFEVFGCLGNTR
jgi:hypothetical protein